MARHFPLLPAQGASTVGPKGEHITQAPFYGPWLDSLGFALGISQCSPHRGVRLVHQGWGSLWDDRAGI